MKRSPVDGGEHVVRAHCPRLNVEKEFSVTVDGDDVMLGCWDFEADAECAR